MAGAVAALHTVGQRNAVLPDPYGMTDAGGGFLLDGDRPDGSRRETSEHSCTPDGSSLVRRTFRAASASANRSKGAARRWDRPTRKADRRCNAARNCCAPRPGGTIGVARTGIFLSSMTASPPSTFFSCAFTADATASTAVVERKRRRGGASVLPVRVSPLPDRSFFPAVLQMQGVVFAGVQAVHARHAAAVIDAMVLVVDAGGLAAARTEAAIPALLRVEHRTEQRETGEESQDRSHGTDRIAIGASVPPCQHGQHDQCQRGDNERRQALHPHLRFIKA